MIARLLIASALLLPLSLNAYAQDVAEPDTPDADAEAEVLVQEPPMTLARMAGIISTLDPEARAQGAQFALQIEGTQVFVVTDPRNDRMRAMVPIREVDGIDPGDLARMMQANFDTALDARYAIAQGSLWAVYIHPLSPLQKNQFISGLGQAVNLAKTYGSLYTGGAMTFGGGDSNGLHRELIDGLIEKGGDAI